MFALVGAFSSCGVDTSRPMGYEATRVSQHLMMAVFHWGVCMFSMDTAKAAWGECSSSGYYYCKVHPSDSA